MRCGCTRKLFRFLPHPLGQFCHIVQVSRASVKSTAQSYSSCGLERKAFVCSQSKQRSLKNLQIAVYTQKLRTFHVASSTFWKMAHGMIIYTFVEKNNAVSTRASGSRFLFGC